MSTADSAELWLSWQLADSGFPTGAFAHSGGLEAATQHGLIPDEVALERWLLWSVEHQLHTNMGYVLAAHRNPERLLELDAHAETTHLNPVAHRASVAQGNGLIGAAAAAFPDSACPTDKRALRAAASPGHFSPIFGAITARLGLQRQRTQQLFVFCLLRDGCSAAVRLGRCGPMAAQRILASLSEPALAMADEHASDDEASICGSGVLVDVLSASHDQLYSRLFQS